MKWSSISLSEMDGILDQMLESMYVASNIASLLDSFKLILGKTQEISMPEIIPHLGLKARLLCHIEVNTRGIKLQGCHILYQSGSKMSLMAGISQAKQCKAIVNTVDPSFNNLIINLPFVYM